MNERQYVVIPVPRLKEAKQHLENIDEVIGHYIEAIQTDDFASFFDKVIEKLPENGDLEDCFFDKEKNAIINVDILEDSLTKAFEPIKRSLSPSLLPLRGFEVLESKQRDNDSVVVTLVPIT